MLQIWYGPAGAGKTGAAMEALRERVLKEQPGGVLLVPEQYSHEAERELCRRCPDSLSRFAEVLSFTSLARRVLTRQGGAAQPTLDKGGRLLCMTRALGAVGHRLKVYAPARRRAELPELMLAAVDECKSAGIDAEALARAAEGGTGALADKLRDAALVFEAYEAVVASGHADPLDRLTLLAEKLPESDYGEGSAFYIDGFIDFTRQELSVIAALLRTGAELTVCLTLDGLESEDEVFTLSRRAARLLLATAKDCGADCTLRRFEGEADRSAALRFFAGEMFRFSRARFEGETEAVTLFRPADLRAECEFAAARALALTRETGCRWRDIAVAARGFDEYRPLLESAFRQYGVPLFTARRSDLMQKPLPALIRSAYELLDGGWDVDELSAYLRSGLTGLTVDECDTLENYVFLWQLRAGAWERRGDWQQHPDGYGGSDTDESRARLDEINALRRRVAGPLLTLKRRSDAATTAADQAGALAAYLEQLQLPVLLENCARFLAESGQETLAAETRQLWELTVSALEQCEAILGEADMDREGFGKLFCLVLSKYDVGSIPVALDRVSAGDFDRMRRRSLKHLIVLSASDQRLPMAQPSRGLFTEEEREQLLAWDIDLGGAGDSELWREFALIYHTLSLPGESLCLSCPLTDAEGEVLRPAFVFSRAQSLFDLSAPTPDPDALRLNAQAPALSLAAQALRQGGGRALAAAEYFKIHAPERFRALEEAAALGRGRLSPGAVEALYGRTLRLSASRIDRFSACQFSYFCQFGLKAQPREPASFSPPEIGSFLHSVLESCAREVSARGGFAAVDDATLHTITDAAVADYVRRELNDFQEKSPRFVHLFRRLSQDARRIVADMAAELRCSDFVPLDFELDFSKADALPPVVWGEGESAVKLSGVADRVDGWLHGGKLYLRVVDYKTGKKKFSLSDLWYGMSLQMLLYLFALEQGGSRRYGSEIVPAGVMYLPARDALLSLPKNLPDDEAQRERQSELRRSGLVLDDPALLEAWERGEDKRYIPVRFRSGKPTGEALASLERLGLLRRHMQRHLADMAASLRRGSIEADPWFRSAQENACLNCEYFEACHFADGENGERCRYQPKLRDKTVWERMEEVDADA